tara:strand:- start:23 stop:151 length:129 start_codon:yes stop_codon:yes gene_type:complete
MKKFVIGDIHGCYTALLAVVDAAGIAPEDLARHHALRSWLGY